MHLKSKLLNSLTRIPNIHTVPQRKALLAAIGFDFLDRQINYEGITPVFCNELIEQLRSEGQVTLVSFLRNLVESGWIGLEDRHRLTNFADNIQNLTTEEWNTEFWGINGYLQKLDFDQTDSEVSSSLLEMSNQDPQTQTSLSRMDLIQTLGKLTASDFDTLIFVLEVPPNVIPSSMTEPGSRAFSLLRWAESPTGCGLLKIETNLRNLLPQ